MEPAPDRAYRDLVDDRAGAPGFAGSSAYQPPPAFAPPQLRAAPLNEYEVLGTSTYAPEQRQVPPPAPLYRPVAWHPALAGAPASARRGSRRLTLIVSAAVVAVLVTIVSVLSSSGTDGAGRSLTLPDTAGDYNLFETITGSQLMNLASGGPFATLSSGDVANARAALYSRGSSSAPSIVFIGFVAKDSPDIGQELRTQPADEVVDMVLSGAGAGSITPTSVPAGPLGGVMKVAQVAIDSQTATVGVWADNDTLGMVMDFDPTDQPSTPRMGAITLALRSAAEH